MNHTLPYSLTRQVAVVVTPVWSVTVTAYTPLFALLYALIWSVVSCCSTLTRTFGLAPAQSRLPPEHVASFTPTGDVPLSGCCSQVIAETSSRGPCSTRAFRTRLEPGITCTGCSVRMCTDIHWRPLGTEDRDWTSYVLIQYVSIQLRMTQNISYSSVLTFRLREDLHYLCRRRGQ